MGLIGSIVSTITGVNAAQGAANAQKNAAQQGLANSQQQQQSALGAQNAATQQQQTQAAPYTGAGASATSQLANMAEAGYGQTFQAPTAAQAAATPGYQFQLQQGEEALQNSAAARGGLLSGGTAKALDQYSQGLASTNYQNTYNNALNAYQQNYGQYTNQLNALQGISNTGAGVTNNLNALNQAGAQNQGALDYNFAGQQNQQITNKGNAIASGYVGSANALNSGINQANNAIMQGVQLAALG